MGFKTKTSATSANTAATATSTVGANTPITLLLENFKSQISMMIVEDFNFTLEDLGEFAPELQAAIKALLKKFNVAEVPDATVIKYKAAKQEIYTAIALSRADGVVICLGDYDFVIPADTDITDKPYGFNGSKDNGWQIVLDRGGINLQARCFIDQAYVKDTMFEARMMQISTAGQLSEYLARGEKLLKWSEAPENCSFTIHDITAVMDREDTEKVAYAVLLAEDEEGEAIRLYAPGEYSDYAGIEFPVAATKTGYQFVIEGRELKISSGGSYVKLVELEPSVEYKVVSFDGAAGKFGWQATLQLEDGRKVNGNKAINSFLQGKPDDAITAEQPATLFVDKVETVESKKDGKTKHFVNARLQLAQDAENPALAALMAKVAARNASKKKAPAMVGNPL